jgi:hypothetical protein
MGSTKVNEGAAGIIKRALKLSGLERKEIVARLEALAEVTTESLTAERIDLYLQALEPRVPFADLAAYLERTITSCRWFPKIPEILEACGAAEQTTDQLAETAWAKLEEWLKRWYHGDLGLMSRWSGGYEFKPPPLDARTEHTCRMIGHYPRIWASLYDEEKYTWVKKEFIASWKMAPEVAKHLYEDKNLLAAIVASAQPVLPPPRRVALPVHREAGSDHKQNAAARPAVKPDAPVWTPLTEEEFNQRKAFLRKQADELMAKGKDGESS